MTNAERDTGAEGVQRGSNGWDWEKGEWGIRRMEKREERAEKEGGTEGSWIIHNWREAGCSWKDNDQLLSCQCWWFLAGLDNSKVHLETWKLPAVETFCPSPHFFLLQVDYETQSGIFWGSSSGVYYCSPWFGGCDLFVQTRRKHRHMLPFGMLQSCQSHLFASGKQRVRLLWGHSKQTQLCECVFLCRSPQQIWRSAESRCQPRPQSCDSQIRADGLSCLFIYQGRKKQSFNTAKVEYFINPAYANL